MPKGRRNTPNRLATRRSIALESGGSPGLALVGAPAADDLKVVLDPGLDLAESVGDIASELVRAVAAARTPLDAELALSPVLGMLDRLAPPDAAPEPPRLRRWRSSRPCSPSDGCVGHTRRETPGPDHPR
jgi:hypothetical protein